jgi:hypothetical protein
MSCECTIERPFAAAHELSQENPDAPPEENWLRAESEPMAAIQMAVFGHP